MHAIEAAPIDFDAAVARAVAIARRRPGFVENLLRRGKASTRTNDLAAALRSVARSFQIRSGSDEWLRDTRLMLLDVGWVRQTAERMRRPSMHAHAGPRRLCDATTRIEPELAAGYEEAASKAPSEAVADALDALAAELRRAIGSRCEAFWNEMLHGLPLKQRLELAEAVSAFKSTACAPWVSATLPCRKNCS